MLGTRLRLGRLFPGGGRRLFAVPLDHSVSMGPIDGLEAAAPLVTELQDAGVDLVVVTKGAARDVVPVLRPNVRLGVHLSASTSLGPEPDRKHLVGGVADAVALGADLVSVQVNFGVPGEGAMLADLGRVADDARSLGIPLLCMAYAKGPGAPTLDALRHAARAAADLGADIVKTSYPGDAAAMRAIVRATPVPVLIGGGVRAADDASFVAQVEAALRGGAAGICIGRNLFQRDPVGPVARRLAAILHPG